MTDQTIRLTTQQRAVLTVAAFAPGSSVEHIAANSGLTVASVRQVMRRLDDRDLAFITELGHVWLLDKGTALLALDAAKRDAEAQGWELYRGHTIRPALNADERRTGWHVFNADDEWCQTYGSKAAARVGIDELHTSHGNLDADEHAYDADTDRCRCGGVIVYFDDEGTHGCEVGGPQYAVTDEGSVPTDGELRARHDTAVTLLGGRCGHVRRSDGFICTALIHHVSDHRYELNTTTWANPSSATCHRVIEVGPTKREQLCGDSLGRLPNGTLACPKGHPVELYDGELPANHGAHVRWLAHQYALDTAAAEVEARRRYADTPAELSRWGGERAPGINSAAVELRRQGMAPPLLDTDHPDYGQPEVGSWQMKQPADWAREAYRNAQAALVRVAMSVTFDGEVLNRDGHGDLGDYVAAGLITDEQRDTIISAVAVVAAAASDLAVS